MSDSNLHPVMQDIFAPHMPFADPGTEALHLCLALTTYAGRNDPDDLDFGRGLAKSGILDRAVKLVNANAERAGVVDPPAEVA